MLKISASQASTARSCWMKYKFIYIDNLIPKKKSTALSLGSIVHECFDLHFNGKTTPEIMQHINKSFDEEMRKASPMEQEDLIISRYTAMGMWLNYPNKDLSFQEIESEKEFTVTLDGMHGVRYTGRVDGDVKQHDTWWIRDTKITGLGLRQFEGRAAISYQGTGYIYGIAKQEKKEVQGIFFDCIKKPLLQKRVDEDADAFGRRIMNDYADPKKLRQYFTRHYTYRSKVDIQNFLKDTRLLAREIRKRRRTGEWYRNPDACWSFNSECPFKKICFQDTVDPEVIDMYYDKYEGK